MLTALKKKKVLFVFKKWRPTFFCIGCHFEKFRSQVAIRKKKIHTLLILLPILHSTLLGVCHSPVGRVRLRHRR